MCFLLQEFFGKFGKIQHCQLVIDRHSRRSRGFAFVHFVEVEDAIEVCELTIVSYYDYAMYGNL